MTFLRNLAMLAAIAATLFLLVACGGGGGDTPPTPGPGVPPQPGQYLQVIATTPAGGTDEAMLDQPIEVAFSAALDATQFPNPPLIVRVEGIVIPGTIDHDAAGGTLTFTPTNPFPHGAAVEITAQAGIMDVDGNTMTADVAVDFTTRLPRFGSVQDTLPAGEYGNARIYKQNTAGRGAIVHTDGGFQANATLRVTHVRADGSVLGTDDIGSGSKLYVSTHTAHVAENGDIVVAWRYSSGGHDDCAVRVYDASAGTWGNVLNLDFNPSTTIIAMEAAVAANGDAIVTWSTAPIGSNEADKVYIRGWDADGGWTGTFHVEAGTGRVRNPRVAMGAGGHGILVWGEAAADGERTHAQRWSAADGFSAREPIDTQAPSKTRPDDVIVDANGHICVIYTEERGPSDWTMWSVRHEPSGMAPGWQSPERLDDAYGTFVGHGQAAVDSAGHITLAWGAVHGTDHQVLARRYVPATGWGALRTFAYNRVWIQHGIALDVAPDGTTGLVVQERFNAVRHVYAAVWSPESGMWSTLDRIATTYYDNYRPIRVKAWRDGHILAAWTEGYDDPATETATHAVRWISTGGVQRPIVTLNPGANDSSSLAGIGLAPTGRGMAVWTDIDDLAADTNVLRHRWID